MNQRIAAIARRSSAPAVLALAFLALPILPAREARGQQEGDTVVVTMKSGKKYTVKLVSRDASEVKFKLGSSELTVPASMVSSIEVVDGGGGRPAPATAPAPAPAPSSSKIGRAHV